MILTLKVKASDGKAFSVCENVLGLFLSTNHLSDFFSRKLLWCKRCIWKCSACENVCQNHFGSKYCITMVAKIIIFTWVDKYIQRSKSYLDFLTNLKKNSKSMKNYDMKLKVMISTINIWIFNGLDHELRPHRSAEN